MWFAVFGGTAINLELSGAADIVDAVAESPEVALFATLNEFPLAGITSLLAILLVAHLLYQRG